MILNSSHLFPPDPGEIEMIVVCVCFGFLILISCQHTTRTHTAPHRPAPHHTSPHRTAPHHTTPHHTTPHHASPSLYREGSHIQVPSLCGGGPFSNGARATKLFK